jgi:hypothetical protein
MRRRTFAELTEIAAPAPASIRRDAKQFARRIGALR